MKKKIIIIIILLALIISGELYLHRDIFDEEVITVDGDGETLEAIKVIKYKKVDLEAFNQDMEDVFKKHGNVGLSIAVFKDDKIIHTFNIGYEDRENGIYASDETKYRIASTSKLIASFGLMRLYDKGLFKIDQPIEDVTGLKYNSDKGDITFIDLLTHTAGIYDSLEFSTAANGQRYDLDYILENSHMNYPVGSKYLYSNFGFGSVGAIIEKLSGEYFHTYMRNIFNELGIDAAYCIDELSDKTNVSKLYPNTGTVDVKRWGKTTKFFDSYGLGNSYLLSLGELIINASDLAKLGIIMAGDGTYEGVSYISNEALDLMNTSYFTYIDDEGRYHYDVGLGTNIYNVLVENRSLHGHTGYAYQASSALLFDRIDKTGFALCSNRADRIKNDNGIDTFIDDVADTVYKHFFTVEE